VYLANPDSPAYSDAELDEIQAGHLSHLASLGARGLALTAGPFSEQTDPTFRGLVFFSVGTDEALALSASDPAVTAGRLRVEVMTWHREAGTAIFPGRI
jgi:uncharacterized protein YciI